MPGIVKSKENKVLRKILIPVDGDSESNRAIIWYAENMKRDGDLVIFLHILSPILPSALSGLSKESELMPAGSAYYVTEKNMQTGRLLCQQLVHEANKRGITSEAMIQIDTKPGPAIIKIITEQNIDNVIMFKRNLGFFKRAITGGSVSSYVLHHSHIAVSIISQVNNN
ncbi:unnamed protein product [Heterobilharzia americana]|nr:unnamed protein product [Heterobilharzia americana]